MITNFLKNLGLVKARDFGDSVVNLAASIDPDAVSETAILQKQDEQTALAEALADARSDLARELREFNEVEDTYKKRISAAELAKADLDKDPTNEAAKKGLESLLTDIEKIMPRLLKERSEYEQAVNLVGEYEQALSEVSAELVSLRSTINELKAAGKEADLEMQRAEKREKKAKELAGLRTKANKFDIARSALQKNVEEKQKQAAVSNTIAQQLTTHNIPALPADATAYLERVQSSSSTLTLEERFNKVRNQ
jgi:hypothetical protein